MKDYCEVAVIAALRSGSYKEILEQSQLAIALYADAMVHYGHIITRMSG
jgi:hypothetical protein